MVLIVWYNDFYLFMVCPFIRLLTGPFQVDPVTHLSIGQISFAHFIGSRFFGRSEQSSDFIKNQNNN